MYFMEQQLPAIIQQFYQQFKGIIFETCAVSKVGGENKRKAYKRKI